ncbi:helix-turn-helix domain-containing protein [Rhodopseudomonas palustris]|uniref:helix-turn-helix domain-containing protein n=1 Tax=Rhodopseudomonas palustris TaxID=1076 RepID=UPI0020CF95E6|nr:helix-turn-helix transcriptional regulator [Rhodopseudomonas palustris]MCP9626856.1 helix-turn-helix domain-containing protein [Rhodopseudomonas palustris]
MSSRGDRMVQAMRLRGMTKQHALAFTIGVNESTVTRWKNDGPMSVEHAVMLCTALDISLDWFLTGAGPIDAPRPQVAAPCSESGFLASMRQADTALSEQSKILLAAFIQSMVAKQQGL